MRYDLSNSGLIPQLIQSGGKLRALQTARANLLEECVIIHRVKPVLDFPA
jgi:hypothetical protein